MTKEAELDERFSFGPPPIQTAEDAVMAFLRKEIDEDEFRTACGKYGVIPGTLFKRASPNVERIDDAYEVEIPEDIYEAAKNEENTLEHRQKLMKEKEEAREKALKENPPVRPEVAAATPVHEVGGTAHDVDRKTEEVRKSEAKEDEKLPPAQTASTKK